MVKQYETQTQGIVQLLNQQQDYQVEWVQLNLPKNGCIVFSSY